MKRKQDKLNASEHNGGVIMTRVNEMAVAIGFYTRTSEYDVETVPGL